MLTFIDRVPRLGFKDKTNLDDFHPSNWFLSYTQHNAFARGTGSRKRFSRERVSLKRARVGGNMLRAHFFTGLRHGGCGETKRNYLIQKPFIPYTRLAFYTQHILTPGTEDDGTTHMRNSKKTERATTTVNRV